MILKVKASPVFNKLSQCTKKIRVLEGGSRSSKTWSILLYLIIYCLSNTGKEIFIARKKSTWLRLSVLSDFEKIMKKLGLWNRRHYNKTDKEYRLSGNVIRFIGLDEDQKLHGVNPDIFWLNEAIEATKDDFDQLVIRVKQFCIMDYNPKASKHWIYSKVLKRPDCDYIHSTMLDNPFLPKTIINEILAFDPNNPENVKAGTADRVKWEIYGLGKRAQPENLVFQNFDLENKFPDRYECKVYCHGLDFGFTNDPTALMEVSLQGGNLYVKKKIYEKGLVNIIQPNSPHPSIEQYLKELKYSKRNLTLADSAAPKDIRELQNCGYNVRGIKKGQGSVSNGIDILKRYPIKIWYEDEEVLEEFENYSWKYHAATDTYLNEPIDRFNHAIDAIRYVALDQLQHRGTRKKLTKK